MENSGNMKKELEKLSDKWTIEKKRINLKGAEIFDEENLDQDNNN